MATLHDVRRICSGLPGAEEGDGRFGFGVPVGGKAMGFVWSWMERIHPKRPKVENRGVLAISVPGRGAKEVLRGAAWWVDDPHYDGYPAVLVRLESIGVEELEELITQAWRGKAPKNVLEMRPLSVERGPDRST